MQAELVLDCRNVHGEGILFNPLDGRVWWTDIDGRALWWFEPETSKSGSIPMKDRVCCFAPRRNGGFLLALAGELSFYDPVAGFSDPLWIFEPHNSETRTNDGRTDRQGRFVCGGMNEGSGAADSSVIRVDADGSVKTLIEGVSCANSTCFSPDGKTMYFADSPQKTIRAYTYGDEAPLAAPRTLIDMHDQPGLPDGSCVDAEGYIWNAQWEGYRVARISPQGEIDRIVEVPVEKPTCCAFGGPDLDTLYITTSRQGSGKERLAAEPHSGGLFAIKPGVKGIEDTPFAG